MPLMLAVQSTRATMGVANGWEFRLSDIKIGSEIISGTTTTKTLLSSPNKLTSSGGLVALCLGIGGAAIVVWNIELLLPLTGIPARDAEFLVKPSARQSAVSACWGWGRDCEYCR